MFLAIGVTVISDELFATVRSVGGKTGAAALGTHFTRILT